MESDLQTTTVGNNSLAHQMLRNRTIYSDTENYSKPNLHLELDGLNHNFDLKKYSVIAKLGEGAYGKVYLVNKLNVKEFYAMKWLTFPEKSQEDYLQTLSNEITILSNIKGQFLAQAYYSFLKGNNLFIVMEYMEGGDLR